ncbi:uncharacterized protein SPPG_04784 [Spizellomyces punctatus DAOM BR117]|uniref:Uncharacterized protein n=1 Tax=Spizellomyces punctatus (strain DAOM BR117) TaxID=645134 RepID=A0A0L0HH78_SPIPD|nr:uncharacterized protein SPPG_04784 [Spizellomyces punctatus DAOM BR117]KND00468.1 hypothetical protein SPPG_04784 [Spizellomyces punctatus DAOM BR117]|eukprot:XP_016608507.1 hypothetical protein SPPG_04784 [Spizellomyces punctatus DAOM BR117]
MGALLPSLETFVLLPKTWDSVGNYPKVREIAVETHTAVGENKKSGTFQILGSDEKSLHQARLRLCALIGEQMRRIRLNPDVAAHLFDTVAGKERIQKKLEYLADMHGISIVPEYDNRCVLMKGKGTSQKDQMISEATKQLNSFQCAVLRELQPGLEESAARLLIEQTSSDSGRIAIVTKEIKSGSSSSPASNSDEFTKTIHFDDEIMEVAQKFSAHGESSNGPTLAEVFKEKINEIAKASNVDAKFDTLLTTLIFRGLNEEDVVKAEQDTIRTYKGFKPYIMKNMRTWKFEPDTILMANEQTVDLLREIRQFCKEHKVDVCYQNGDQVVYLKGAQANIDSVVLALDNLQKTTSGKSRSHDQQVQQSATPAAHQSSGRDQTPTAKEPARCQADEREPIVEVVQPQMRVNEQSPTGNIKKDGSGSSGNLDNPKEEILPEIRPLEPVVVHLFDSDVTKGLRSNQTAESELIDQLNTIAKAYDISILYSLKHGGVQFKGRMSTEMERALLELRAYLDAELREHLNLPTKETESSHQDSDSKDQELGRPRVLSSAAEPIGGKKENDDELDKESHPSPFVEEQASPKGPPVDDVIVDKHPQQPALQSPPLTSGPAGWSPYPFNWAAGYRNQTATNPQPIPPFQPMSPMGAYPWGGPPQMGYPFWPPFGSPFAPQSGESAASFYPGMAMTHYASGGPPHKPIHVPAGGTFPPAVEDSTNMKPLKEQVTPRKALTSEDKVEEWLSSEMKSLGIGQ